jgi:uncharacterized membrane protein YvbJ
MKFGKNQLKPRGYNYRPFYLNERDEEREKMFGHLHNGDNERRKDFKPKFNQRKSTIPISDKIMKSLIILVVLIIVFVLIYFKEFYIPKKYLGIFE